MFGKIHDERTNRKNQLKKEASSETRESSVRNGKRLYIEDYYMKAKKSYPQRATYVFLGICLFLFIILILGLFAVYSNLFFANYTLLGKISENEASNNLLANLMSQQSVTLTITGVVAAFLGLLFSGLTILRELKLDKSTQEVEQLKIETKELIRELKSTYDMLIIKNSFSSLENGAFINTKRTMLLHLQNHLEDIESSSELFDHHMLDELYSYTSYKFGYPTHSEAKDAYKRVEFIGKRLLARVGSNLDYSSCCKRYITHLKCAEAGYNLLTNCGDITVPGVNKPQIYHTIVKHYKSAQAEEHFSEDMDGFIECRLGLLEIWNERYKWDASEAPLMLLNNAKHKLMGAIKKNNSDIWYYSLAATCIRLCALEENPNVKEDLLSEADSYCKKSLLINAEAINAYVNLANIRICRVYNLMNIENTIFRAGSFIVDSVQQQKFLKWCDEGLAFCKEALRRKQNSIGALRKKATLLSLKTKVSVTVAEKVNLFTDAISSLKQAEEVEEICTHGDISLKVILPEKEALRNYLKNSDLELNLVNRLIELLA